MKYPRPTYREPGFPTFSNGSPYGNIPMVLPVFDTPITPRENFLRAAKRDNPMWVPNQHTDMQEFNPCELATHKLGKFEAGPNFRLGSKENYTFIDPYGNSWTWEATAQGAMLTPGTKLLEDICDWEKVIKWPIFDEWTYKEVAEEFMANKHDPKKALGLELFQGCTEMLVAFLGGYGEGMVAMAEEPEACADFFDFFADRMIAFFDYLKALYPIDIVTYHDDWGTQISTFFSPKMFEELVYEPTKKIVSHVQKNGTLFNLHTCGKIDTLLPYMADIGFDYLQLQLSAVDAPKLKAAYNTDKMGLMIPVDGHIPGAPLTDEQMIELVRKNVDLYASRGGYFPWIFETGERPLWTLSTELYCYSREFYDKEQGRA